MGRTQETQIQSLGWEDPLEEKMATHSIILAWKIPWTEESGGLLSRESQRVEYDRACTYMPCQVTSVVSDSVRPHRWQPTRLPHPWDSPGKNTGEGCHFLLQCMKVKSESEVTQSCPTLSNPMDCSPPGSSVHGIYQARALEWGAIAFSDAHTYLCVYIMYHLKSESQNRLLSLFGYKFISEMEKLTPLL